MRINIKTTNFTLTPEIRRYALEKIGTIERFFGETDPDIIIVDIELGRPSRHHRSGDVYRCEVNVSVGKTLLRAEEKAESMTEAIDNVRDEISREVKRWQSKKRARFMRSARKFARRIKFFRFRE